MSKSVYVVELSENCTVTLYQGRLNFNHLPCPRCGSLKTRRRGKYLLGYGPVRQLQKVACADCGKWWSVKP